MNRQFTSDPPERDPLRNEIFADMVQLRLSGIPGQVVALRHETEIRSTEQCVRDCLDWELSEPLSPARWAGNRNPDG